MNFKTSDEVYSWLYKYINFSRSLESKANKLDRTFVLDRLFGCPDQSMDIIHVAGSKGKGSTSTMISAILEQKDEKVGLYTSPHLLSFKERIAINRENVSENEVCKMADLLYSVISKMNEPEFPGNDMPTFFEMMTILSFLIFKDEGCKKAVLETGMGGRLDSTNIVDPICSVITTIELEHTEILGDTIAKIASEKAGIIKKNKPIFSACSQIDAIEVIRKKAKETNSPLFELDKLVKIDKVNISKTGTDLEMHSISDIRVPKEIHIPMIGLVQARNAALSSVVCSYFGYSEEEIVRGLEKANIRARFEITKTEPPIVLDGAHTQQSMIACVDDFKKLFPNSGILLFSCVKGKDEQHMAHILKKVFSDVIITKPGVFKSGDLDSIEKAFLDENFNVTRIDDCKEGIKTAINTAKNRKLPLLVTGSFYLCGEVAREIK